MNAEQLAEFRTRAVSALEQLAGAMLSFSQTAVGVGHLEGMLGQARTHIQEMRLLLTAPDSDAPMPDPGPPVDTPPPPPPLPPADANSGQPSPTP